MEQRRTTSNNDNNDNSATTMTDKTKDTTTSAVDYWMNNNNDKDDVKTTGQRLERVSLARCGDDPHSAEAAVMTEELSGAEEERDSESHGEGDEDGESQAPTVTNSKGTQNLERFEDFDDLGLSDKLLRGVYNNGFEHMTPIQELGIKPIMDGRDLVLQAQAGQGKTGTFSIGALHLIDTALKEPQVLVLSPTRELAEQTGDVMAALSKFMGVGILNLVGGKRVNDDIQALRDGEAQVVSGTAGRLNHMLEKGYLQTEHLKLVILDEADVLLSKFNEEVSCMISFFPQDVQVVLVTATVTAEMMRISKRLLRDPVNILIDESEIKLATIQQFFVGGLESFEDKLSVLLDLYKIFTLSQTVIFVDRRRTAHELCERLLAEQFSVAMLTSDMSPEERTETMKAYRRGEFRVLIATNLAARGIDVQQISMVVNHSLPPDYEDYIHRVGRSGRHNRKGLAINLLSKRDEYNMGRIAQLFELEVKPLPEDIADIAKSL